MTWSIERDRYFAPIPVEGVGELVDGDLTLRLVGLTEARPADRWAAEFIFDMIETGSGRRAGIIRLRLAETEELVMYGGQIGYGVDEPFRGRRYAARAVILLLPLARANGMETLWITCDPENVASRRSIEIAGGEFVEIVDIPEYSPMYAQGRRLSCRYRFDLA